MVSREEKSLMTEVLEHAIRQLSTVAGIADTISKRDPDTLHAISVDLDTILEVGPKLARSMRAIIARYERGL